jgi:hypothetical protein
VPEQPTLAGMWKKALFVVAIVVVTLVLRNRLLAIPGVSKLPTI